ncbi:MAG: selenocysteine-specific translation elongation factor, partial [Actinomycetota bacterium]|nr:selenocysteine-specific translation elongation factor [Actinomycetota bacterium]
MYVVATAGHVDHGKSTLVRTLTGMEPDRWAEERRRGLTIDLGFAWTHLHGTGDVAFVDVPGHERFVGNMLAGVGSVPAALVVVAADEGWMPQTEEHVAVLDALGVRHAVLALTRADLVEPTRLTEVGTEVAERLSGTSLGRLQPVAVSAPQGRGVDELRHALAGMLAKLPAPDAAAPVRLWVDRSFTVRGSGTVVTGTLAGGTLAEGDELLLTSSQAPPRSVRVRAVQSLGRPVPRAEAVARVAVNLRGIEHREIRRGEALLAPGAWWMTSSVDVLLDAPVEDISVVAHIGSAAVPTRVRPLGPGSLRLAFTRPLPLRVGDVVLLRDAGRHLVLGGAVVADVD